MGDKYYCDDCQSGRLPLYNDVVWVKLGAYRWWPALVLLPTNVPDNVERVNIFFVTSIIYLTYTRVCSDEASRWGVPDQVPWQW